MTAEPLTISLAGVLCCQPAQAGCSWVAPVGRTGCPKLVSSGPQLPGDRSLLGLSGARRTSRADTPDNPKVPHLKRGRLARCSRQLHCHAFPAEVLGRPCYQPRTRTVTLSQANSHRGRQSIIKILPAEARIPQPPGLPGPGPTGRARACSLKRGVVATPCPSTNC